MNNVKYFLLIIFLISQVAIQGKAAALYNLRISGKVIDAESKKPLVGVNIIIKNSNIGASSDLQGRYAFLLPDKGRYIIEAQMIGFETQSKSIIFQKDTVVNFKLYQTILESQAVDVIGERQRDLIKNPSLEPQALEIATSSISRREIEKNGAKTVIDALNYIPGSLTETRGRKVKQFFSMRGQKYPYPEYAVNGAWQREFLEMPYFFSTDNIERIEIIRSSAALLSGVNGMAGVINIIPKTYDHSETFQKIEYGSYGTLHANISHGAKLNKTSYALGVGMDYTNGPKNLHAMESINTLYASISQQLSDKFSFNFNLFHINGKRQLRFAEPPAAKRFQQEIWSYDPVFSTLLNLKIKYKQSERASLEFLSYYSYRDPVWIDEDENTHEVKSYPEKDYEYGAQLIQAVALSGSNTLRIGGLYNHWIAPDGKRFYVGKRNDLHTFSAVAVDEQHFGAWNIDAGIRWSQVYMDEYAAFNIEGSGKPFAKVDKIVDTWQKPQFQGSFGVSYYLNNNVLLSLNGSGGQIKPRDGTLDTDLQVPQNENRLKIDVGSRIILPGITRFTLSAFLVNRNNAIILSGKTYDLNGRVMELYDNRDQKDYGLEADFRSFRLWNSTEIFANALAMTSRYRDESGWIENKEIPAFIVNSGLYFTYRQYDATLLCKYVSKYENNRFAQKAPDGSTPPQPLGDFVSLNLNIGWSTGDLYHLRFYLDMINLSNVRYSTVVGYPDYGRRFLLGISLRL